MSAPIDIDFTPILRNVGKHVTLTDEESAYFLSLLKPKLVKKGQFYQEAGEVCRTQAYVISGCMRSYHIGEDGKEHILQFAPADWWTGDMASFVKGTPAMLDNDALEDSLLLQMERTQLDHLYERVPKFERFFRILITNALIAQQRRMLGNLGLPAEERYAEFRKLYPSLDERVAQKHIASYLGITPEFLSTVKKRVLARK
jgi:CRP-like cAMP-binding protein